MLGLDTGQLQKSSMTSGKSLSAYASIISIEKERGSARHSLRSFLYTFYFNKTEKKTQK